MTTKRTRSRTRRLGVVALGVLAAVTCSTVVAGTAAASEPHALDRFYGQQLAWGPCTPFAQTPGEKKASVDPALECARMEVPLDYDKPNGQIARIAVSRYRTNQARTGSLVLNPGGPGGSGLFMSAALASEFGNGPFDLVGFDPRGVGSSTPTVHCLTPEERRASGNSTGFTSGVNAVSESEAQIVNYIHLCEARSGGDEVLANVGTRDVARDLDVLRAVLGDRKLTYLGFSYGTRIGATYAEMFTGNVRAMVLDGVIDPTQTAAETDVAQWAGFQHAFDVYAADCARKPSCPLGTDAKKATTAYQALTRPLLTKPVRAGGGRSLTYSAATTGTFGSLYNPASWPLLTKALTSLKSGDGGPLLKLADGYDGELDSDAQTAINCVDQDRITDRAVAGQAVQRIFNAAPFRDPGIAPLAALDTCGLWPVPPTSTPHMPHADGLPPTLVISTTGDPATPYDAGVRVAKALHSHLLTVEGTQHTAAAKGNQCVDGAMWNYLVNMEMPDDDTRCVLSAAPGGGA